MSMYTDNLRPAQARTDIARIIGQTMAWLGFAAPHLPAKELAHLDDHLLRDIGLERSDVGGTRFAATPIPDIEIRRLHL